MRMMRSPMMLEKETFRKVKITKKEEMVMRREKSWQNVKMKVKIYKGRLKNNMKMRWICSLKPMSTHLGLQHQDVDFLASLEDP